MRVLAPDAAEITEFSHINLFTVLQLLRCCNISFLLHGCSELLNVKVFVTWAVN